jgi:hypothetical protein
MLFLNYQLFYRLNGNLLYQLPKSVNEHGKYLYITALAVNIALQIRHNPIAAVAFPTNSTLIPVRAFRQHALMM